MTYETRRLLLVDISLVVIILLILFGPPTLGYLLG